MPAGAGFVSIVSRGGALAETIIVARTLQYPGSRRQTLIRSVTGREVAANPRGCWSINLDDGSIRFEYENQDIDLTRK